MAETEVDAQVVAALRDVVTEKGWTLVNDGGNGTYAAELVGVTVDPMVAAATPDGLVRAINAYEQRQNATKPGWQSTLSTVIVGTVREEHFK
jgi:hypothetical protein